MESNKKYFEANKFAWDQRTEVHVKSDFYNVEAFKNGASTLEPMVLDELKDVEGKTLLHLQCHFGMDTLSFARMGAKVTGVDLSPKSMEFAEKLSKECNIPARFIESNVLTLTEKLDEKFDIVFTSFGAICWLPNIDEWAAIVSHFLKPGGTIYLAEFHPYLYMWDWDSDKIMYPYFCKGKVFHEKAEGTYTDGDQGLSYDEYFWIHTISDVHTALQKNNINIEFLHEFDYTPHECIAHLEKRAEREFVYKINGHAIPAVFSMKGIKRK